MYHCVRQKERLVYYTHTKLLSWSLKLRAVVLMTSLSCFQHCKNMFIINQRDNNYWQTSLKN